MQLKLFFSTLKIIKIQQLLLSLYIYINVVKQKHIEINKWLIDL